MNTIRVLVVDDTPAARDTIRAHLSRPGFSLIDVASGLEAIQVLKTTDIDVILLDAMMPGMDGLRPANGSNPIPSGKAYPL